MRRNSHNANGRSISTQPWIVLYHKRLNLNTVCNSMQCTLLLCVNIRIIFKHLYVKNFANKYINFCACLGQIHNWLCDAEHKTHPEQVQGKWLIERPDLKPELVVNSNSNIKQVLKKVLSSCHCSSTCNICLCYVNFQPNSYLPV
jgi:hypothetical protein